VVLTNKCGLCEAFGNRGHRSGAEGPKVGSQPGQQPWPLEHVWRRLKLPLAVKTAPKFHAQLSWK